MGPRARLLLPAHKAGFVAARLHTRAATIARRLVNCHNTPAMAQVLIRLQCAELARQARACIACKVERNAAGVPAALWLVLASKRLKNKREQTLHLKEDC